LNLSRKPHRMGKHARERREVPARYDA
jgi:hypothetical protein